MQPWVSAVSTPINQPRRGDRCSKSRLTLAFDCRPFGATRESGRVGLVPGLHPGLLTVAPPGLRQTTTPESIMSLLKFLNSENDLIEESGIWQIRPLAFGNG